MKVQTLFIATVISLFSCSYSENTKISLSDKIVDSLTHKLASLNEEIKFDQEQNPHIQLRHYESGICTINLYIPCGLNLSLVSKRPTFSNETFLLVPAAYTSKQYGIDGFFVENGTTINPNSKSSLTGACILSAKGLRIIPFDSIEIKKLASTIKNESVFQQSLLIYNNKVVKCDIFDNIEGLRRALIQFEDISCIAESHRPVTIQQFQEALRIIGVKNAINLDMGSWSEGVFRSSSCDVKKLGDNFANTKNQTSWLVYLKQ